MDARAKIAELVAEVRSYQNIHKELLRSHHFVVAVPLERDGEEFEYLVVGLNPGEQPSNWRVHPGPTEETIDYDWLDSVPRTGPSKRWRGKVEYFCQSTRILQSDLFFWSTNNIGQAFVGRFGTSFASSPHLDFCRSINLRLVEIVQPKAVVAPGISHAGDFAVRYGLVHVKSVSTKQGHKLIAHYEKAGTPWVFTKHWGGAFGFSNEQREEVRGYIASVSQQS